jgi:hypothetical protein
VKPKEKIVIGGLSLILSEALVVIVVAMVSAIVLLVLLWSRYRCRGVKYQGVVSKYCHCIEVSGCQSVSVHCKDTGMVIDEFQLLLDFKTLRL